MPRSWRAARRPSGIHRLVPVKLPSRGDMRHADQRYPTRQGLDRRTAKAGWERSRSERARTISPATCTRAPAPRLVRASRRGTVAAAPARPATLAHIRLLDRGGVRAVAGVARFHRPRWVPSLERDAASGTIGDGSGAGGSGRWYVPCGQFASAADGQRGAGPVRRTRAGGPAATGHLGSFPSRVAGDGRRRERVRMVSRPRDRGLALSFRVDLETGSGSRTGARVAAG